MGEAADDLDRYLDKVLHYEHIYAEVLDVWVQRDGTKIKIVDMETSHIQNTLNMLHRNNPASRYIPVLTTELKKRK